MPAVGGNCPIVEFNESLSLQAFAGGVVGFAVSYALDCNGIIEQVRCAACAAITALVLCAVRNFPRYHRKCNEWRGRSVAPLGQESDGPAESN